LVFLEGFLNEVSDSFRSGVEAIIETEIVYSIKQFFIDSKIQDGLFSWHEYLVPE